MSRDARFYITTAYPFLVVAVDTDLSWISGIGWAFIATVMFVYGFQALDSPEDGTPSTGEPETAPAPNTMPPRTAARRKSADSKH